MRFLAFYRMYGIRKLSQFMAPVMLDESSFLFPYFSKFYYFKPITVIENISRDTVLLKRQQDVIVRNMSRYDCDVVGNFREVNFKEFNVIKEMRNNCREFRFPMTLEQKVNIKNKTLEVFNYTTLNKRYVYPSYPLYRYHMFLNSINTLVTNVNKENIENKFIYLELPDTILNYATMNRLAENSTLEKIKKITDYRMLALLELWKYLSNNPEFPSVFEKLENPDDVILILGYGNRVVPLAFGILNKLIKGKSLNGVKEENDIEIDFSLNELSEMLSVKPDVKMEADFTPYRLKPIEPVMLKKMFFLLWSNIVNNGTVAQLDENLSETPDDDEDEKPTTMADLKATINSKLDKIITEDIPAATEEEYVSETYEVGDEEIEEEKTSHEVTKALSNGYGDVDVNAILSDLDSVTADINKKKIEELRVSGVIQKAKATKLIEAVDNKQKMTTPFKEFGKKSIAEVLEEPDRDIEISRESGNITDNPVVMDKTMNKDTVTVFNKTYVDKYMRKDTLRVINQLEHNNFVLDKYEVTENSNILNTIEEHNIEYKMLNGKNAKVKFYLPKINEDGTFRLNKNTYKLRLQKTEVPISKLDNLTVLLNSYYGKLFVSKANRKSENYGDTLLRRITLNENITKLILEEIEVFNVKLPSLYEKMMRNIKSFRYRGIDFTFDYSNRLDGLEKPEIITNNEKRLTAVYVGKNSNYHFYLGYDNKFYYIDNNNTVEYNKLSEELEIKTDEIYSEFVTIKLLGKQVPVYLLFSYYIGIENALKLFKLQYEVTDKRPSLDDDHYAIKMSDGYIVVKRDYGAGDLVFVGASRDKKLSKVTMNSFNTKENFGVIFNYMDYNSSLKTEIAMLENFYIDPMTKELLRSMKEPITFIMLLKRATEMLVSDERKDLENIELQVIKGVERVNGMLYRELMNSIKDYELKSVYGRNSFTFDPYSVMKKLKDDNTTILVNDLNPIGVMSQQREVTLLGSGGRDVLTIKNEDRKYNRTYYGTFTEHYKDNGDTGINAQLTSCPYIENVRGLMSIKDRKIEGAGDVSSMSTLLSPMAYMDDGKRLNFCSIQNAHLVPIMGKTMPYIRTGYESVLPISLDEKFIIKAEAKGEVVEVKPKHVKVKYGEPINETKTYKIKGWTSKEESESCYRNEMKPNVQVGDKVEKDDTLIYNTSFFIPDIFNKKRVMYVRGTFLDVCVSDFPETFEDSSIISGSIVEKLATRTTKVKSIILDADKDVPFIAAVGTEVKSDDAIMTIIDRDIEEGDLPAETLKILKELKKASPKAKVNGTVSKIEIYYNADIKTYSKNVRKLIDESDIKLLEDFGYTGQVDHTYSVRGKPLKENQFEIKMYIDVIEKMGVGDKGVFGNQLKTVIGDVYNNKVYTEDGREVEAFFGYTSIQARVVSSPYLMGTTATLLDWVAEKAIEAYFGKL